MIFRAGFMWKTEAARPPIPERKFSRAMRGLSGLRGPVFVLAFCALAAQAVRRARPSTRACRRSPVRRPRSWGRCPAREAARSATLPGAGGILGGRPGVSTPKGIPTTVTTPGVGRGTDRNADADFATSAARGRSGLSAVFRNPRDPERPGGRRTRQRLDSRSRHRDHTRAQPRPPLQVLRDPHGQGRHRSRPASDRTPSSIKTASSCNIAAPARSSLERHRAARARSIPTSPTRSTSRTNARPERQSPAAPRRSWRRNTRTLSGTGSTTSTGRT